MAELVTSILAPTVDSAVKNVGAVIIRQFKYLCCFSGNIRALEAEAVKLDNAIQGLRARVDAATNNVEDIDPEVSFWLSGSDNIKEETARLLNEARNVDIGCSRIAARFTLSKGAAKTAITMVQQRQNCCFSNISLPPRTAASSAIPLGSTNAYEFESRKMIEADIMKALGDNVKMVGICGMGGLGKTTMAKRIMNRALKEKVFDEVVIAVVSQQADDQSKIQLEIGGSLGLDLKDESSQARVQKLHERLAGEKRILLVLDDVWTSLNLIDLGIPCDDGSNGCTILITSRNKATLTEMDVREVFGMEHLSEEDAWFLFKKKAGACADESKLSSTAKKVAKKCNGLPIALAAVGAALKDVKGVRVWRNALKQLRKPNPKSAPDFIAQVYNPVIVSYDALNSEEVRSILLLCCLFPEDSDISIDLLSMFCFGLCLFEDIGSLEEARDTTWTAIKSLKDRSLLLDSKKEDCVRMHDSVRDVCAFISEKKGYIGGNDCRWLFSSGERIELSTPNSHLLLLKGVEIDGTLFEGIRDLKVLSIESSLTMSLPQTTQLQKNLRTLRLYFTKLEEISVVGELVNLEIFICNKCLWLKELPVEIKRLNRLRLLDLSGCSQLHIGPNIISSLVGLEELKIMESFNKWEGDDGVLRENAGVRELEALANLRCLEIEIVDPALAAQNFQISSKLERFKIQIPNLWQTELNVFDCESNKSLALDWKEGTCLGHWIEMQLLRDTECLYLTGKGGNKLDSKKLQNLRRLVLGRCESVNNIVFPLIEYLYIYSMDKQQEIWDAPVSLLTNLSSIEIRDCPRLLNVGQLLIAGLSDCLPQLETLVISHCKMMEQVFLCTQGDQHENISEAPKLVFPRLKKLVLSYLPNLTTFCKGIEATAYPLLETITISKCPKLRSMISTTSVNGTTTDDHHSTASQQVSFGSLKVLWSDQNPFWGYKVHVSLLNQLQVINISYNMDSTSLFTASVAENLVSLRELYISDSRGMSQVIEDDREKGVIVGGERTNLLFPNLAKLELKYLDKLVAFCEWECDIELPSLMIVEIFACPKMKIFTLGSLSAPKWQELRTNVCACVDVVVNGSFSNMKNLRLYSIEYPLSQYYKVNGLERLEIGLDYDDVGLFTSSVARNLFNLEHLFLCYCSKISKVIEDGEEDNKVVNLHVFPKLKELHLYHLPNLVSFWEWKGDVEWPSLRKVTIFDCPNLTSITLGPLTTPKLTSVRIDYEEYFDAAKDLNAMIQKPITTHELQDESESESELERENGELPVEEIRGLCVHEVGEDASVGYD